MKKEKCSERIKEAMQKRNIKQVDICQLTGIPKSAMSQYINGKFEPKQDRVYKISKALNVSEAWLMGYDVPMERENDDNKYENIKAYDENDRPYILDDETLALLDSLRSRPEIKILFSVSKKATKEDILKTIKIIEALRNNEE